MNQEARTFIVDSITSRMVDEPDTPLRTIFNEVAAVAILLYGTDAFEEEVG